MPKSVLVVDDSRVALVSLRRMLLHHGLMVDAAESGEEAIEYLRSNPQPSAVFLDHMMPGMDGFQTLGAIRKDARLTTVPIVMYTSQEGESYMSQALARGAYDVLRKPLRPLELLRILERLSLLRSSDAPPARVAEAPVSAGENVPIIAVTKPERAEPAAVLDVAPVLDDKPSPDIPPPPAEIVDTEAHPLPVARFVFYAVLAVALLLWYLAYRAERAGSEQYTQRAPVPVERPAPVRGGEPGVSSREPAPRPATETQRLLETVSWALNLHGQYGYTQLPFDDQRLTLVRELAARLAQADFRGVVRLDSYVGEFCLARDGFGGFRLPEAQTRIAECEVLKYTADEAEALGRRQSPAFARYLAAQAAGRGNVRIEIVSHGTAQPALDYPDYATTQTAGEWNAVALRNNRVHISLIPARELPR